MIAREDDGRALSLARASLVRPQSPFDTLPLQLVVVDVARQRLFLIHDARVIAEYPISTAAAGIGGDEGSMRTPPGWHRINARIGDGEPIGAAFESRVPTGSIWNGEATAGDLILTRILTLEGLEDTINRGPGRDSLERYIYVHGTNHPEQLGRPGSHGCVRMSNDDVVDLFDRVRAGDPVVIADGALQADPRGPGRFHYAGIGGSGMSALAQFQAMNGGRVSGSDRAFDRGDRAEARAQLESLGIVIHPQDGSAVLGDCVAVVASSAVEDQVPDIAAARAAGLPIIHRSEMLAHYVETHRTIAVAGTSGKSTVVAMIFEILRGAGRNPSVITGGELRLLQEEGLWGNAWHGSDLLVVEADESDGSLVRYQPAVGVVLNLQRDHKETSEVAAMFATFRARAREAFVVGEEESVAFLAPDARTFGLGPRAEVHGADCVLAPESSTFRVRGETFTLPVPGRHNVLNALAAIAACEAVGVSLAEMVVPLGRFRGVERRFQVIGSAHDVLVVDDFAHNPAKLEAAITTAQRRVREVDRTPHATDVAQGKDAGGRRAGRVLAIYQPHGYGPTRFLRKDFVETFAATLGAEDRLWLLEVYYAGGTAKRDFSSADIVAEIAGRGANAEFAPSREWLVRRVADVARPGDLVLVMGARDPSLTELAKEILKAMRSAGVPPTQASVEEAGR